MLPNPLVEYSSGELTATTYPKTQSSSNELNTPVADKRMYKYIHKIPSLTPGGAIALGERKVIWVSIRAWSISLV